MFSVNIQQIIFLVDVLYFMFMIRIIPVHYNQLSWHYDIMGGNFCLKTF